MKCTLVRIPTYVTGSSLAEIVKIENARISNYSNYTVLQKYAHIGLKQNLLRWKTLDIITRLLDNAAFVCVHVVGRFSKDFSEVPWVGKSRVSTSG